jgi:hypothetical protein
MTMLASQPMTPPTINVMIKSIAPAFLLTSNTAQWRGGVRRATEVVRGL